MIYAESVVNALRFVPLVRLVKSIFKYTNVHFLPSFNNLISLIK